MKFFKTVLLTLGLLGCTHNANQTTATAGHSAEDCEHHHKHVMKKKAADDCPIEDASPEKKKSFEELRKVCAGDIEKLCKDNPCPSAMKPLQVCLMSEAEVLSASCKKEINRHIGAHQPHVKTLD